MVAQMITTSIKSVIATLATMILGVVPAIASESTPSVSSEVSCAQVKKFQGETEILSADRKTMIPLELGASLPCGSWLSVSEGNLILEHSEKYLILVSGSALFQIFDHQEDEERTSDDELVLYRGKLMILPLIGAKPFRVITAGARVVTQGGAFLLSYLEDREESELIAFQKPVRFENRHESSRGIDLKGGEASSHHFRELRVLPTTPKVIAMNGLKQRLAEFPLEKNDVHRIVTIAGRRHDRTLASVWSTEDIVKMGRAPASTTSKYTYDRSKKISNQDEAEAQWMQRMVGGMRISTQEDPMLFPKPVSRKPASAVKGAVRIHDSGFKADDQEKDRILKELSKIRLDD